MHCKIVSVSEMIKKGQNQSEPIQMPEKIFNNLKKKRLSWPGKVLDHAVFC